MSAKFYSTMAAARGALALDTGFDPFISGGWGRCTLAKLAQVGYPVDPVKAKRQREAMAAEAERERLAQERRSRMEREAAARPQARKYAAAGALLHDRRMSMVEIGDDLAHVQASDGRCCVVELVGDQFVARLPRDGERVYV